MLPKQEILQLLSPLAMWASAILCVAGVRTGVSSVTNVIAPAGSATLTGNLQWPQEVDSFTPEADTESNIWFARDVEVMADTLNTEPLLVVVRDGSGPDPKITPLPVDTARIPNDHLQYAITWFSLAAIWLAMTVLFLRRRRAPATPKVD